MFGRITFEPKIMGERACIRGMRIPVSVIVGLVAHGATVEEISDDYPDLEREDVMQVLELNQRAHSPSRQGRDCGVSERTL